MSGQFEKEQPSKKKIWVPVLILSLLLVAVGVVLWFVTHSGDRELDPSIYHPTLAPQGSSQIPQVSPPATDAETETPSETESRPPVTTEEPLPDNPVDFEALALKNQDIYAWIYLPIGEGKDIDLPILQSSLEADDNYYLHTDLNGNYRYAGELYTQKANAKDFSDRVTVVYGHNMLDGTMFSNLVFFLDDRFFQEHEFFYIYTPGHILTYRIAAAVQFDTRHILNCFDFSNDQVYADWIQNYILEPKSMIRAVREGMEVTTEDKLVILSTCLEHGAYRYLIQGVLISDEPTK